MLSPKVAAIMSSLSTPIKGKPTKLDTPKPRPKTPSTPGLGTKMREETSRSLEKMLKEGAFKTGLESLVKNARSARGLPMGAPMPQWKADLHRDLYAANAAPAAPAPAPAPAHPSVSWQDAHRGVAQLQAQNISTAPAQLPPARTVRDELKLPSKPSGGAGLPPIPNAPGGASGGGGPGMLRRFGRGAKGTAALVGLGALGAGLYGMHRQNERDRQQRSLVYAPLSGSLM